MLPAISNPYASEPRKRDVIVGTQVGVILAATAIELTSFYVSSSVC